MHRAPHSVLFFFRLRSRCGRHPHHSPVWNVHTDSTATMSSMPSPWMKSPGHALPAATWNTILALPLSFSSSFTSCVVTDWYSTSPTKRKCPASPFPMSRSLAAPSHNRHKASHN
eukprot:2779866-Rhodomonas_salina.5